MILHWMEYVCVGCGGTFRYTTRRTYLPQRRPKVSVKMRPCPTCGLYQPDMVAARRWRYHLWLGLGSAAAAGLVGAVGLLTSAPERWVALAGSVVAALTVLAQAALMWWDPNRNSEANRERAKQYRRAGELERLRGETPELAKAERPRPRFGRLAALALGGIALGTLPFFAGELVRLAHGWPTNPGWYPAVVGPGDESRIWYDEVVPSIQGLWDGQAAAEVVNAREVGLAREQLDTATNHDAWGDAIWFNQKSAKTRSWRPWVGVRMPDDSQLAGKELRVKVDLSATYPADRGKDFINVERGFTQTTTVRLAGVPGAGKVYASWCRRGLLGGAVWLVLMSLVLALAARSFRREAFPAKVYAEPDE